MLLFYQTPWTKGAWLMYMFYSIYRCIYTQLIGGGGAYFTESESNDEPIDLELHTSAKQLEGYGLEHLKQDLMRRGLKCGGSLEQRALRLFR